MPFVRETPHNYANNKVYTYTYTKTGASQVGVHFERITTEAEVEAAVVSPPADTRAWFRGECMRRYPDAVAAASWDSVVFDVPGNDALMRVATLEPTRGTRSHVGALLDASPDVRTLIDRLGADAPR